MRVKVLTERPMGRKIMAILEQFGEEIVDTDPDMLVVAYYPRILKPEEFQNLPMGAINLHPGMLPYNRGMYPHIWPLVDNTPAGVTIHYIDEQVDHGDIIAQRLVSVEITDTAGSLEKKMQLAMIDLFIDTWKSGFWKRPPTKQEGEGTFHWAKEIAHIQEFDKDIIMKLRACTFDDRSYGYFIDRGKKVYVGVKFFSQEDIDRFNEANK